MLFDIIYSAPNYGTLFFKHENFLKDPFDSPVKIITPAISLKLCFMGKIHCSIFVL